MKRWAVFAVLWPLAAARALAGEAQETLEDPIYPCVDAAVIATNVRFHGFPIKLPGGDKISIAGVQFDVERVLYGSVNAKQLTLQTEDSVFVEEEARDTGGRSIFFLSGAGERWELAHHAPGVGRDVLGRDVYPLPEPPVAIWEAKSWLPADYSRYLRAVTPAPDLPWQRAIVLDELPQVIAALRKLPCIEAAAGGPAPSAAHWRVHGDYESLASLERQLRRGMPRGEVEALLGPPGYSPTDGQYYYDSNHTTRDEWPDHDVSLVLVVDYRNKKSEVTDRLQGWFLGPVGE